MPIVSVTRLRVHSVRFLPAFTWHTFQSARQLRSAAGFLGGAISADVGRRTFWTTTVWKDDAAMRDYRNSGWHRRAMPHLLDWCDEASVAHWPQQGARVPPGAEALAQMLTIGRLSKVRHPSTEQGAGRLAPDGRPPVTRPLIVRPRP